MRRASGVVVISRSFLRKGRKEILRILKVIFCLKFFFDIFTRSLVFFQLKLSSLNVKRAFALKVFWFSNWGPIVSVALFWCSHLFLLGCCRPRSRLGLLSKSSFCVANQHWISGSQRCSKPVYPQKAIFFFSILSRHLGGGSKTPYCSSLNTRLH